MEDGFEKLTAGDKTCETCRPDGLKVSNVNGIRRIEVPETFGRTPGATLETEIAEAMSIAANWVPTKRRLCRAGFYHVGVN